MRERSDWIDKLIKSYPSRVAYTKAKLSVNIASQIKALRQRRGLTQKDLGAETGMLQSRISTMERPGATSFTIDTLARLASAFNVGLIIKFAPFGEMLKWDNEYNQDFFNVEEIDKDERFLNPDIVPTHNQYVGDVVYLKQSEFGARAYTKHLETHGNYEIVGSEQTEECGAVPEGDTTAAAIIQ